MAAETQKRKKRLVSIGLIALFAILTCSLIVPLAGARADAPGNRTAITAVIIPDSPPTSFQDPDTLEAAGFAVEVMDEIAARAGLSVTYHFEKDWEAVITAVRTGKADIAPVMGITAERQKILAFSSTVDTYPLVIFVRSNDDSITELRSGLSVGVIGGSSAYEIIKKKYDKVLLRTFNSYSDGLFHLLAGNIDAFCCASSTLLRLARDAGVEDRIKIVGAPLVEYKRGMAMRKDDVELFAKLNTVIEGFVGAPEYQRIYTKWFGKTRPFLAVSKKSLLRAIAIFMAIGAMALWRYISIAGLNRKLHREISERARAENTLREKNTMLQTLIHAIPDPVIFKDSDGRYLLVNKAMEKTFGFGQDAFVGKTDDELSPPDVAEKCKRSDGEAIRKGGPIWSDESYTDKNGETRYLDVVKAPISDDKGGLKGLVVISRDITERKQGEDALRESEEKFSKSFQKAPLLITLSDVETGRLLDVNEKFLEVSGFARDEVIGRTVVELGWNSEEQRSRLRQSFLERGRVAGMELTLRRKDGRAINCLYNGEAITVGGKPRLLSIAQDITERIRAENQMRESENKFRSIFEKASDGIMIADAVTRRHIEANTSICMMLGYARDELVGMSVDDIHPKEDLPLIRGLFEKQLRGEISLAPEVPMLRKNGSVFYADINATPVTLRGKQCLAGIFRDITDRKRAEELILSFAEGKRSAAEGDPPSGKEQHAGNLQSAESPGKGHN